MKKILLLLLGIFLFAQNAFVNPNGIYVNTKTTQKYYNIQKAYLETKSLIKLTNALDNSDKFKNLSSLKETGNTKVYTYILLDKLKNFLEGEKAYSNTMFENNDKTAGILKILSDKLENCCLNLPSKIKQNINNSIESSGFFTLSQKTLQMIKHISKNNISDIMKNYKSLFDTYVKDISKLNIPLIKNFNQKIKRILLTQYRIEAKASLIKILNIFKTYIDKNEEIYE
jgi:hypothetical protein